MRKTVVSDHKRKINDSKKSEKRKKKKFLLKLGLIIFSLIFIMSIVGITLSLFSLKTKRAICGVWSYDTITVYQFEENGNGNLILPENRYPFTYQIDRDLLFLDFEEENLTDITFQYSVNKNTLSIINNVTGQELILEKYE